MVPTNEHWRIREWARAHGATPAQMRVLKFDGEPAILTFVFGEAKEAKSLIQPISWDMFFAQFDLLQLSIAFDETTPNFNIVRVDKLSSQPAH